MSSFWENNKGSIKNAGIATAKGIGSGSKAIGKAGVRTYKNHEAKRKGLPPPTHESSGGSADNDDSSERKSYSKPLPRNDNVDLGAYAPPPKRNVGTFGPGSGNYRSPPQQTNIQPVQQPAPTQSITAQPVQQPASTQSIPAQPVLPPRSNAPPQTSEPEPAPAYTPVAEPEPPVPSGGYRRAPAPLPPTAPQSAPEQPSYPAQPIASQAVPPSTGTVSPPPRQTTPLSKESLNSFAPPPIHKDRGSGSSSPSQISRQNSNVSQIRPSPGYLMPAPDATSSNQPSAPSEFVAEESGRKPLKVTGIDLSKAGPPPPKYNGPALKSNENKPRPSSSHIASSPPPTMPSRPSVGLAETPPPLPSRRSDSTVPRESTPRLPTRPSNSLIDTNQSLNKPKKAPPAKPVKKPIKLAQSNPPPYTEEDNGENVPTPLRPSSFSQPTSHNFAEEISLRKVNKASPEPENETVVLPSKPSDLKKTPAKPAPKPKPKLFGFDQNTNTETAELNVASLRDKLKKVDLPKNEPLQNEVSEHDITKSEEPKKAPPVTKPKPQIKPKPSIVPTASSSPSRNVSPSRSAPPPPPPRSNSTTPQQTTQAPPPPPSRNYNRSKAVTPEVSNQPPQIDLELPSGWFANTSGPLQLPSSLNGLNYSTNIRYSTRSSPIGTVTSYTRGVNIQFKDLSRAEYEFTWENDKIDNVNVELKNFTPSPISHNIPTKSQLLEYHNQFSEYVASWAEHKLNQQVGSGECWDLAHEALLKGCGKHAFVSTYTHHGFPILNIQGSPAGLQLLTETFDEVRRGDVLQFFAAKFENKASGSTLFAGAPDHTAIVVENTGDKLIVLEQNVGGVRKVCQGSYTIRDITSGSIAAYRPVPVSWAEKK
ncbi:hypothetical protein HYPBUDRAFT_152304, partial [Hyphopichia burtonii NRRL Y-1933]